MGSFLGDEDERVEREEERFLTTNTESHSLITAKYPTNIYFSAPPDSLMTVTLKNRIGESEMKNVWLFRIEPLEKEHLFKLHFTIQDPATSECEVEVTINRDSELFVQPAEKGFDHLYLEVERCQVVVKPN